MNEWEERKYIADKHSEEAKETLKYCITELIEVKEATLQQDQNEASDFMINYGVGGVGWRIRQLKKDDSIKEWTIRSRLDSGNETELSKLKKGFGRWYLYQWIKNDKIDSWIFIDLDIVREKGIFEMEWVEKANFNNEGEYDGTYYISIPITFLWDKGIVLSHNIQKDTEIKIKEKCNMVEISKTEQEWIEYEGTHNVGITPKMVEGWYIKVTDELKHIGLDKSLGGITSPEFIQLIKSGVRGEIQKNISVEATTFEVMILGPYPQEFKNKKFSVKMAGFACMNEENPQITSIYAVNDFLGIEKNVEPLESYQTGFSFFPDMRILRPERFELTVQGATEFSEETKIVFMGKSYEEKLELLRQIVPKVNLIEIEKNHSRLIQSKSKYSVYDILDLKRISICVTGTATGIDKNRKPWTMFKVVDGSSGVSIGVNIPVWVNPSIFNKLQAGKDSLLEIYGTIEKNYDGSTGVNACFIHPFFIAPIDESERSFGDESDKELQNETHSPEIVWPGNTEE